MPRRCRKLCAFHAGCHYNTGSARGKASFRHPARDTHRMYFFLSHPDGSRNVHTRALFRAARMARRKTYPRPPRTSRQPATRNRRSRTPPPPPNNWPDLDPRGFGRRSSSRPTTRRRPANAAFPRHIFVSTTTETGQRLARERLQSADGIFYFPLDWVVPVRRALRAIRPALVIVMETEIWPNFLREARRANVPVIFANARISKNPSRASSAGNSSSAHFLSAPCKTPNFS